MSTDLDDPGFSATQLWAGAWVLGIASLACILRLIAFANDGTGLDAKSLVWLAGCVLCAIFSAVCTVLVGLKSVEERLSRVESVAPK